MIIYALGQVVWLATTGVLYFAALVALAVVIAPLAAFHAGIWVSQRVTNWDIESVYRIPATSSELKVAGSFWVGGPWLLVTKVDARAQRVCVGGGWNLARHQVYRADSGDFVVDSVNNTFLIALDPPQISGDPGWMASKRTEQPCQPDLIQGIPQSVRNRLKSPHKLTYLGAFDWGPFPQQRRMWGFWPASQSPEQNLDCAADGRSKRQADLGCVGGKIER